MLLLPVNVERKDSPFSSAAIRVNGLKVDPACAMSWVTAFCGRVMKSGPPYIARIAPSFGSTETMAVRRFGGASLGIVAAAATAACWVGCLMVVTLSLIHT